MQPEPTNQNEPPIEAVVAIFETPEDASRVAASMRGPGLNVQRVSRQDPSASDEIQPLVYDNIDEVDSDTVAKGILQGGALGAGSGLLLLGVPVLNIAAPIAGAIAGAFIGGVAGVDEANRGIELPNREDYQRMLAEGKSFVVISGDEATRIDFANKMQELGALEVHQHPPVLQTVRTPDEQKQMPE